MKKRENNSLMWLPEIDEKHKTISISEDFAVLEDFKLQPYNYPYKTRFAIIIICDSGGLKWQNNLKTYATSAPSVITFAPGQIVQIDEVSEDYNGSLIVMSERFINNMMPDSLRMQMMVHTNNNPFVSLNSASQELFFTYCKALKMMSGMTDNPYRIEMVKHLTMMFFYMAKHRDIAAATPADSTRQVALAGKFIDMVKNNFKQERQTDFYARKLSLTPKYLSQIVKSATGKFAAGWIDDYVILEAKALLKSTNMTIQQISDELNFPSQSFFGKYFKRVAGVSPKEYRER
jgi:AraC-like DNA-binding protein